MPPILIVTTPIITIITCLLDLLLHVHTGWMQHIIQCSRFYSCQQYQINNNKNCYKGCDTIATIMLVYWWINSWCIMGLSIPVEKYEATNWTVGV